MPYHMFDFLFLLIILKKQHDQSSRSKFSKSLLLEQYAQLYTWSRAINNMSVPILDFAPFHHGTKLERAQLYTRIIQERQKNGAVRLISHGVPAEPINQCYE